MNYLQKYFTVKKFNFQVNLKKARKSKMCYAFLAPYAILFFMFNILPVLASIFFSFTYYNVLEPPKFIGLDNYINLILEDDVFLTGVKNTFLIAVINRGNRILRTVNRRKHIRHLLCVLQR